MYHKGFVNTVKPSHSDRHGSAASLFGDYSAPNLKSYEIVAAAFKRMNMNANTLTFNFILVRRPCEEHEFFAILDNSTKPVTHGGLRSQI